MKNKITAGQVRIIICLFCAVIFVLCYEFVYLKYEDKAEALTKNTELIQKQIEQSKTDQTTADELKAKIKDLNSQSDEIINSFPVNIAKEDDLVFIDEMEKKLNIDIPSVQISDTAECFETILPIRDENGKEIIVSGQAVSPTPDASETDTSGTISDNSGASADNSGSLPGDSSDITNTSENPSDPASADTSEVISGNSSTVSDTETAAGDVSQAAGTDNATAAGDKTDASADTASDSAKDTAQQYMTGLKSSINISFKVTTDKFLKLLDYIYEYPQKTSVSDVALNYDGSTGDLMCSMTINRYALKGNGKKYEEPYIGNISIGTDDIFGTKSNKK